VALVGPFPRYIDHPETHLLVVASTGDDQAIVSLVGRVREEAGSVDIGRVKEGAHKVVAIILCIVQLVSVIIFLLGKIPNLDRAVS
jgi:hypothetical protein